MKLKNIGFMDWNNRFIMIKKKKKSLFKGKTRDISNDIFRLLICMAINNKDKLIYKYEEKNRTFYIKVEVESKKIENQYRSY